MMDYYEEDNIGLYGEDLRDDQAAWDWGRELEIDINHILDDSGIESMSAVQYYHEQMSFILTHCVHEDDYEGQLKAEEERRFAAFCNYAEFIKSMDAHKPIINDYFAGDVSCAW